MRSNILTQLATHAVLIIGGYFPALSQVVYSPPARSMASRPGLRRAANSEPGISTQNTCMSYTYDHNGNRLTQVTSGIATSTPMWGSSLYPCFSWNTN